MSEKVFIVEDNLFYGELLKKEMQRISNSEVQLFTTAESFITNMSQNPQVIIMDHHLGTSQGVDIVKQIKDSHPNTFVIFAIRPK